VDKINELSLGEKIIGGSGIVLLILSFFTWFSKSYSNSVISGTYNGHNGWGGFASLIGILVMIALVTVVVLRSLTSVELPDKLGNLSWPQVYLIAGAVSFVLVLLQVLVIKQSVAGTGLDASIWAYLGLLASAGLAAGSFLNFQEAQKARHAGPGLGGPPPGPPAGGPPPTV
jgi:hypothetical protein